jgi:HD-GYP domain-containing protein (c-di-GMP phosphodiesterase class II)
VLDKPGKLDADEWDQMRSHAELTVRILDRVPPFRHFARDAGAHHERLDGRGYHLGLTADQLGWMPRILAVADVFEALTADRPYRDAMETDQALGIMRRDAGAAFCPEYFEALEAWTGAPSSALVRLGDPA